MLPGPVAACQSHADREAIGVCVACRARICAECSTKVDGINHCVRCLAALAAPAPARAPAARGSALGAVWALGWLAAGTLLVWAFLEIALP